MPILFGISCQVNQDDRNEDVNMIESELDLVLKAINSLSMRTNVFEDFAAKVNTNSRVVEASQSMSPDSILGTSLLTQNSNIATTKEPWISPLDKFDGS